MRSYFYSFYQVNMLSWSNIEMMRECPGTLTRTAISDRCKLHTPSYVLLWKRACRSDLVPAIPTSPEQLFLPLQATILSRAAILASPENGRDMMIDRSTVQNINQASKKTISDRREIDLRT